jgi:hypothetical protein
MQTKMLTRVGEWRKKYGKPIVVDECCYEGNLPHFWGSISGKEMTYRFWRVVTCGGYCTHGETFLDDENEVLWWAKGGILKGESPKRIAFLRELVEGLPGPLEPVVNFMDGLLAMDERGIAQLEKLAGDGAFEDMPMKLGDFVKAMKRLGTEISAFRTVEFEYQGHCGKDAYLTFYDLRTCAKSELDLPEEYNYRIELIDTWEMKRTTLLEKASGKTEIRLPTREGMAVLAIRC